MQSRLAFLMRNWAAGAALLGLPAGVPAGLAAQQPRSAAEVSGFERYTTHDEMMQYLMALRQQSADMRLSSYGESREGRTLPYAIFSRPLISQPREATLLDRPIVLLAGNVHGGERTLRESLLVLVRDLATRGTPLNDLLDHMVVLVAPQINPDGFHATERGQRGNAWGIDLNRDYIKLEHPEIASYVGHLIHGWQPHLFVDGHNGGSFPYNVNYQCPSHASPDLRITQLCDEALFPFIDAAMQARGFKSWYYTRGTETRWNTGGFQARIGRNYGGFANAVAILFESPPDQEMRIGVESGIVAFQAVLDYVRQNAESVVQTVERARRETLEQGIAAIGEVVVDMRYDPEDRQVQYEIGVGEGDERRVVQVTSDSLMNKPVPTRTRPRPYAYILPRDAVAAIEMLRRHDITVEMLEDSLTLQVQAYTVGAVDYTQQYNHAAAIELTVGDVVTVERTFPRGTYVVPTGQVMGRVVTHMLEPETDDNVLYWNTMDAWLPRPVAAADADRPQGQGSGEVREPPLVPIYKLMAPRPLPSVIVR
jgi:dipeptidyl-peptidase 4